MSALTRIALFAALLALVFPGAALAGSALDPHVDRDTNAAEDESPANLAALPLAAAGLLSPILAGAAMALSSVSVVGNALRLRRFQVERELTDAPGVRA